MSKFRHYSPQLSEELVRRLYYHAKSERVPMTVLANRLMDKALDNDKEINTQRVHRKSEHNRTELATSVRYFGITARPIQDRAVFLKRLTTNKERNQQKAALRFPSGTQRDRLQQGKEVKVNLRRILYVFRVILRYIAVFAFVWQRRLKRVSEAYGIRHTN